MRFAEPRGHCRTVLLVGADGAVGAADRVGTSGTASERAVLDTLADLLADDGNSSRIDVFCPQPAQAPASERVRWHAPQSRLAGALACLSLAGDPAGPDDASDIAWIVAGTRSAPGWQRVLRAALVTDSRIGTVSPLCPGDPLYSPHPAGSAPPIPASALRRWLAEHWPDSLVELPAPLGVCGVLRARAVAALCAADRDWPVLARAGFAHVAYTGDCVFAPAQLRGQADAPDTGSSLLARRHFWEDAHPLTGLRARLAEAAPAMLAATPAPSSAGTKPCHTTRLHIAHSWGGGLSNWVQQFCEHDQADGRATDLVLRSIGVIGAFGQRLSLYRGDDGVAPLRSWQLDLPIHATAIAHLQYRAVLREIVDDYAIDSIIVSSLIGHSLDALRSGLPTLLVTHDHYPFCVALFAHFGTECRQCDATRLDACINSNPGHRFFAGVARDDWLALRRAFCDAVLESAATIVAPSPSVADRWRCLMPALRAADVRVIEHGTSLPPPVAFTPPADGPLRLLMLGRVSPEKGGELIAQLRTQLRGFAHLTLIGCGEEAARAWRQPSVDTIAHFDHTQLPALIAQARPHLGLQLSVVPETFGFTLSEMWHCGLPVLECRTGSLADRIRDGEDGFLVEPDAVQILARLNELSGQRNLLESMRHAARARSGRTPDDMVADYRVLMPAGRPGAPDAPDAPGAANAGPGPRTHRLAAGPVSIDPEVTYLQAARAFLRYTRSKAGNSPRIPRVLRRWVFGVRR